MEDKGGNILEALGREFTATRDINLLLKNVFAIIVSSYKIERGMISIYHRDEDEISVDIHHGYTDEEVRRGIYRPGEGIIGAVVQTGEPVVIPDISRESRFLNRTGADRAGLSGIVSFICVPVAIHNSVVGAISVDIRNNDQRDLSEELHILTTVSIMIAQAVNSRMEMIAGERRLKLENEQLRRKIDADSVPHRIIGKSGAVRDLYEKILMVAGTDSTVLITGESGTGKELIADAVYENSRRKGKPFVKVNIAALPKTLIEAELFGYEKGAFTGADRSRKGRFESAEGGTIFIDEIGDLDIHLQVHLLRVLQNRTIERIGGNESVPVDVRVIAATHHDLEERVKSGYFRSDLFYRLNVFPLYSPPLRERRADIMLLADHFLELYAARMSKIINRISSDAIDLLVSYYWPGNVRELENCIERAVIICSEDTLRACHLPPSLQKIGGVSQKGTLEERTDAFERSIIIDSLKTTKGNISRTADELGTTKRIIGYKMSRLNIDYRDYREG
ncbi:MAG: sigma 54-interacting transcriptional regulator [Spirochaetes bacterium]|nr:sigma 54-interacting transcriptional regulator [Spirochaetota bacterium]